MVHEVPDTRGFLGQVHACLRASGQFLVVEPRFHVSHKTFDKMVVTGKPLAAPEPRQRLHPLPIIRNALTDNTL